MCAMNKRKKRVVITGGSRGIGAEAVRRFAARGAAVAFLYKNSYDAAVALSKETGALNIRCDVSDPEQARQAMAAAAEYFGGVCDVLICNAGLADVGLVTDLSTERWNEIINTNLNAAHYCAAPVLPDMISRQSGSIIIVSSGWGQVGASCEVAYSAAKAGLIGYTKALAKELGPSGIRVNCIAPGLIDTQMNESIDDFTLDEIVEGTPLCRMGRPADVVNAMEFLASDQSSFITGQVLGVNGGLIV